MAQDAMLRERGGVRAGGFNQFAAAQRFERELDRAFRKTGFLRDRAQACADGTPSPSLGRVVQPEINEKGRGLAIMADQVAHQDVENVIVNWNGLAKARHGGDYLLYRLMDSDFCVPSRFSAGRWLAEGPSLRLP